MSKGSTRRPAQVSREEENLRWALATGKITFKHFERRYNELLKEGKIHRNRKVLK